jgi:putative hydrolase of the HAD superfamily
MSFEIVPGRVQAVVFDLGGVLLDGGPRNVAAFGPRIGLSVADWAAISRALFIEGDVWDRVERGELPLAVFAEALREQVRAHGVPLTREQALGFMGEPGDPASHPERPEVVAAVRRLHERMPTALLTNNVAEWRGNWRSRFRVEALFDVVVDSSEVGMRKPEERIYRLTEQRLGLSGAALLFVDDLGVNLKPARALGWQTLKYEDTAAVLAVLDAVARAHPER